MQIIKKIFDVVSTHSRLKAAGRSRKLPPRRADVSTHSRLKAAGSVTVVGRFFNLVSTHSRLKAAGFTRNTALFAVRSFNTQPPEGGWGPS